jgi:hypothetical protein
MKKIIVFLLIVIISSACANKAETPKPKKLIDKAVMENILYDLALLQALKSYSPEKLTKNDINSKTYIYQKYKIDSAQFADNNSYYASDVVAYKVLFDNVAARLEKEKKAIEDINSKELQLKSKKIQDSLKRTSAK